MMVLLHIRVYQRNSTKYVTSVEGIDEFLLIVLQHTYRSKW